MNKKIHATMSATQLSWVAMIFFVLPASFVTLFRPHWITNALGLNYFFLILAVFFCLSPLGNTRFHGEKDTMLTQYSYLTWFGLIIAIELFAVLLFISILQTSLYYLPHGDFTTTYILPDPELILHHLFFDWGLFPFSLYGLLAGILAFFYFHQNQPGLFSAILPPLTSTYRDRVTRRGINIFATAVTNIAYTIVLMIVILEFAIIALHRLGLDNTMNIRLGVAVVYMFVAMLLLSPALEYYIQYVGRHVKRLWIYVIPFITMAVIAIILCTIAGKLLYPYLLKTLAQSGAFIKKFGVAKGDWQLLYWSWWVICAPLFASMLARISKGRTLRELLLGTLLLPTIIAYLLLIRNTYPASEAASILTAIGAGLFHLGNNLYFSLLSGSIVLVFTLALKDSRYSIFGFMPYQKSYVTAKPAKPAQFVPAMLHFTLLFLAAFIAANLRSIQYLATVAAIPSIIFFILCCLQFYRWLCVQK